MRLLLFLIILITIVHFKYNLKEQFCNLDNNVICKFMEIKLPIEKNFTKNEIKIFGESWAKDLYNELFNYSNSRINEAVKSNFTIEKYILQICYIYKTEEVEGILEVVNFILNNKYKYDNKDNILPITKSDTVELYFIKLQRLRYNLFNKLFDEQLELDNFLKDNIYENLNFSILKFHIFYLILDEVNEEYISNNFRYGIYLYLYDKKVFEIKRDYHNELFQNLLEILSDTINNYLYMMFGSRFGEFENLSILKIRNLIINNNIINYFSIKKDLCYI